MVKKENLINFYADYHFVNGTSLDARYKDKIYPIFLMAVVIKVSKPRKPNSVLRSVEKSRRAKKSYGSFSTIMEEIKRTRNFSSSEFRIHLPPDLKKKAKKAESENKKVVILLPPGKGAKIILSDEAKKYLDSKQSK